TRSPRRAAVGLRFPGADQEFQRFPRNGRAGLTLCGKACRATRSGNKEPLEHAQIPLERIQKLSVHVPPAGITCISRYLPACARLTPLMIVVSGSKQMKLRVCPGGGAGSQMVATVYLGPNSVSTVLPADSIEKCARPSASRSRSVKPSSSLSPRRGRGLGRSR